MSTAIKLTPKQIKAMCEQFKKGLNSLQLLQTAVSVQVKPPKVDRKARLVFTPTAYHKMIALVDEFETEVGWEGFGERVEDGVDVPTYKITDIVVYPQTVTSAHVDMDELEYGRWLMDKILEDERYMHFHFHGHSHVRMGTTPSLDDLEHERKVVHGLRDDDFYVFIITNKHRERTVSIYDMRENTHFGDSDVEIQIEGVEGIHDLLLEAKDLVRTAYPHSPLPKNCYESYAQGDLEVYPDEEDIADDEMEDAL